MKQDALALRHLVFVEEQGVPENIEIDKYDNDLQTIVFLIYNDTNQPIATGRMRIIDEYGKAERICVLKSQRGNGCGKKIIQAIEKECIKCDLKGVKLHSQERAIIFYEKLGYKVISEAFFEANIKHYEMVKNLIKKEK